MRYSIKQLAGLSGVTVRTLHWYDQQGLLCPKRSANGYRVYAENDVDRLQLILFYRELDMPLEAIKGLLGADDTADEALAKHLEVLVGRRERLDRIIATMEKTIAAKRGGRHMEDAEKFEAFKTQALQDNEEHYGKEARQRYGDAEVDASNQRFVGLTQEQYAQMEELTLRLHEALQVAIGEGDSTSALAREVAELHKQWLFFFWADYSPEKHRGVTQMYVDDPRFTAHYEQIAPGAAQFLRDAVWAWLGDK